MILSMNRNTSILSILSSIILAFCARSSNAIQTEIISWIRSNGGTFSDKLEIRRVDPTNPNSYLGVFVRDDISAKESLFQIPRKCYIDVFDIAKDMDIEMDAAKEAYYDNLCELKNKLKKEMELGESSEYAPYIAYLKTQKAGQLPANWSKAGKDTLRKVAIPGSPMVDWIDLNFKKRCVGDDTFDLHMIEMTVQRCFDTALIPVWDMVNHDNGRINTENDSMYDEDGMKVRAARDLKAGEELFATYDKCIDCYGVEEYWGTPEILKDFGFVENYPHRWVFNDEEIWFEVYEEENGDDLEVYFGDTNATLSEKQIQFLRNELDRLENVAQLALLKQGDVPDREWQSINDLHEAAVTDISIAIEEAAFINSGAGNDEL